MNKSAGEKGRMKNITLYVACLVVAALPLSAIADDAKVAGTWNLTLETPQGSGTPTLVLEQDGQKLKGTYTGRMGEMPVTGTVKESAITFSVKIAAQGQEFELVFNGTVDGDTMKGTVEFGPMGSANWSGGRKKPAGGGV